MHALRDVGNGRGRRSHAGALLCSAALVTIAMIVPAPAGAASHVLHVPSAYPTIQAAIEAAHPGDTIKVRRGTYVEQLSIDKDVQIVGAGADRTVVRAPGVLVAGADGETSIVEIRDGASVKLQHLAVSGPGAGHCDDGELRSGINIVGDSELDLDHARVVHIRNTPLDDCFRSGVAVLAADFDSAVRVRIRNSYIADYGNAAIVILGEGSRATITHNVIRGQGRSTVVASSGVELIAASGTVSFNVISGNACGSPALGCGPDWFNEFQVAAIGGGAPGTVIANNLLYDNQVGIYVGDAAEIRDNLLVNNHYYGMGLQDGTFTVHGDRIIGGEGGVAVIAAFADTVANLDHVHISHTSGPAVKTFECCGWTATVIGGP